MNNRLLLLRRATLPARQRRQRRDTRRRVLTQQRHGGIGKQTRLQMAHKVRRRERFGDVGPAQAVLVRLLRPARPRRRQQQQPASGAQRASQRGERLGVETAARVENSVGEFAAQQRAQRRWRAVRQSRDRRVAYNQPVARQASAPLVGARQRPLCVAANGAKPPDACLLHLAAELLRRHQLAAKVLHCPGSPLSNPRLNQV